MVSAKCTFNKLGNDCVTWVNKLNDADLVGQNVSFTLSLVLHTVLPQGHPTYSVQSCAIIRQETSVYYTVCSPQNTNQLPYKCQVSHFRHILYIILNRVNTRFLSHSFCLTMSCCSFHALHTQTPIFDHFVPEPGSTGAYPSGQWAKAGSTLGRSLVHADKTATIHIHTY